MADPLGPNALDRGAQVQFEKDEAVLNKGASRNEVGERNIIQQCPPDSMHAHTGGVLSSLCGRVKVRAHGAHVQSW